MYRYFSYNSMSQLGVLLVMSCFIVASLISPSILFAGTAKVNTIELKTEIKEVTIYRGGWATIYREGKVSVPRGNFRVTCRDFPWKFNENSLQVSAHGDVEATIYNVDFKKYYGNVRESERYKNLKKKLKALKDSLSLVEGKIEAVKSREKLLSSIFAYSSDQAHRELSSQSFKLEQWKMVIGFYEKEVLDISMRLNDLKLEKKRLEKRVKAIEDEMQTIRREGLKSRVLEIECNAKDKGYLVFRISYNNDGVYWYPEYRIKLNNETREVQFDYYAKVFQQTLEDWKGVKLNLSTGKPGFGIKPPELEPLYISIIEPYEPVLRSKVVKMMTKEQKGETLGGGVGAKVAGAEWSSSEFSALFHVAGPVDLLSGSESKRFLIAGGSLKGDFSLYSAPSVSENVFLRGKLKNTISLPLLKGNCNVYVQTMGDAGPIANFVGSGEIGDVAAGEEFSLYFGVDKDIKVQRKRVKREVLSSVEDKKRKVRYHYRITVQSFKDHEVALKLEDRIPVSTTKDVKVKDVDIDPKPDKKSKNGIITWNLKLTPKVKYEIRFSYTVVYPEDLPVRGIE